MAYVEAQEFFQYVGSEIAIDENLAVNALAAAEDAINDYCSRDFNVPTFTVVARSYVPSDDLIITHDFVDATGLAITDDGTTVAVGDVQLEPVNTTSWSGLPQPHYGIRLRDRFWTTTTRREATVTVTTARWGWPAVPPQVVEANKILGKDLLHVRQNRFGVAGFGEFGVIRVRDNPHVTMLLAKLRHPTAFGIA